ncbi:MAG: PD-(D/E)XK nuclease family protein [Micrococcaceae bacterium]
MNKKIDEISERIDSNPLGALMHGQRELFHSNLLAWFFKTLPDSADYVFKKLTINLANKNARTIHREKNNMDLVMYWTDKAPLIIENKVFSIPNFKQLEKYSEKAKKWEFNQTKKVLLSPISMDNLPEGWKQKNYSWLSGEIKKSLSTTKANNTEMKYAKETMEHYWKLCRDIQQIVEITKVLGEDETVWLTNEQLPSDEHSQLRNTLNKARAAHVAEYLRKQNNLSTERLNSTLSRTKPLVDLLELIELEDQGKMRPIYAGWQLEGDQFRRHVEIDKGESNQDLFGPKNKAQREKLMCEKEDILFKYPKHLAKKESRQRNKFGNYGESGFYKYKNVPDLTVEQLITAAEEVHNIVKPYLKK